MWNLLMSYEWKDFDDYVKKDGDVSLVGEQNRRSTRVCVFTLNNLLNY